MRLVVMDYVPAVVLRTLHNTAGLTVRAIQWRLKSVQPILVQVSIALGL